MELHGLKHDVGEQHSLATEKPDLINQSPAKLVAWRQSVSAPMRKPRTGQELTSKPTVVESGGNAATDRSGLAPRQQPLTAVHLAT